MLACLDFLDYSVDLSGITSEEKAHGAICGGLSCNLAYIHMPICCILMCDVN